jgi:hypothetical protein
MTDAERLADLKIRRDAILTGRVEARIREGRDEVEFAAPDRAALDREIAALEAKIAGRPARFGGMRVRF